VAIETQVPEPCARCWNSTVTVSASVVAEIVGEPAIAAPGSFSVGVGDWVGISDGLIRAVLPRR